SAGEDVYNIQQSDFANEAPMDADVIEQSEPEAAAPQAQEAPVEPVADENAFEFDDLDLPEYGEEQAQADFANEAPMDADVIEQSEPEAAAPQAQEAPVEPVADESTFEFDDLDLPEYGEEQAQADFANEVSMDADVIEQPEPEAAATQAEEAPVERVADENAFEFDDLDLPEYGEEQAQADFAAEQAEESEVIAHQAETDSQGNERSFDIADHNQAYNNLASELDDMVAAPSSEAESQPSSAPALGGEDDFVLQDPFEFDDIDLPEYGEEQALIDLADEVEDVHGATEQQSAQQPELQAEQPATDASLDEGVLDFDDLELPEFGEEQAQSELSTERAEPQADAEQAAMFSEPEANELEPIQDAFLDRTLDEGDVLAGLFGGAPAIAEPEASAPSVADSSDYDERTLSELLNEEAQDYQPITKPVDREVSDSAGMDLDAMLEMGGEDWNGFSLSPEQQANISDDIPEEERQIWSGDNQPAQPSVRDENWESQDELGDFNPRDHQYRTIDELMAEVDQQEADFNPDEEELKLDVGLGDFPDVIGEMSDIDVDSNAEAAGKLDLAKIYMEMNDATGAVRLLEEAIVDGSDEIRREAKKLIDSINSRA
ncbi:FimV/HubP family polar landmark protein, partial [Vibrio panuliri]|uniref:FimV/HubP family polar landmark protein n=1 Tax=Vibrio panuliri TaxID=1381081 RepID=UPI000A6401D0